jgi:phage tail-like protein
MSKKEAMASEVQNNIWPLPRFFFSVQFDNHVTGRFQEASARENETEVVEYRHGNSPSFYPIKMPGLGRTGNVTLRKGIFAGDTTFWGWYNEIKMNTTKHQTVVISLLDENGTPKTTWTLNNAFPTKIAGTDLKPEASENEVVIESMELTYETLVVSTP